jgi:hypothetical protein
VQKIQKKELSIKRLRSGGVITNYYCTSSCGHCLYCGSPRWEKDYIDRETLTQNLEKIKSLGCHSIHIGGGEPFLDLDGLKMVIETVRSTGVGIEYVETNSSWYRDGNSACRILSSLRKRGLTTLLISMSPFHNEHIPFHKVKGVIGACNEVNMNVFPWISDFYAEIDAFDDMSPHAISEYVNRYGRDYLKRLPDRYWIHFGGRAIKTFANIFEIRPYQDILSSGNGGCVELLDVSHFHFDLFGNYIPGLCSGLAIHNNDLGNEVAQIKYPILHVLFHKGVSGLFDFVTNRYNFKPLEGYMSKCHLCLDLRMYLVLATETVFKELQPKGFYSHI